MPFFHKPLSSAETGSSNLSQPVKVIFFKFFFFHKILLFQAQSPDLTEPVDDGVNFQFLPMNGYSSSTFLMTDDTSSLHIYFQFRRLGKSGVPMPPMLPEMRF